MPPALGAFGSVMSMKPTRAERAVGIDERHAVLAGGDDLGGGHGLRLSASAGRLSATAKVATRLNIISAWAGSANGGRKRGGQGKKRGMAGHRRRLLCDGKRPMLCGTDISRR